MILEKAQPSSMRAKFYRLFRNSLFLCSEVLDARKFSNIFRAGGVKNKGKMVPVRFPFTDCNVKCLQFQEFTNRAI
jgi:hypothetical protein